MHKILKLSLSQEPWAKCLSMSLFPIIAYQHQKALVQQQCCSWCFRNVWYMVSKLSYSNYPTSLRCVVGTSSVQEFHQARWQVEDVEESSRLKEVVWVVACADPWMGPVMIGVCCRTGAAPKVICSKSLAECHGAPWRQFVFFRHNRWPLGNVEACLSHVVNHAWVRRRMEVVRVGEARNICTREPAVSVIKVGRSQHEWPGWPDDVIPAEPASVWIKPGDDMRKEGMTRSAGHQSVGHQRRTEVTTGQEVSMFKRFLADEAVIFCHDVIKGTKALHVEVGIESAVFI